MPQLDAAITKLDAALARSVREGKTATLATRLLPAILGGDGSRRYILAMQNPAEARATGGIFGNWAELTAANGKLELGAQGKSDAFYTPAGSGRVLDAPADYVARYARFAPAAILAERERLARSADRGQGRGRRVGAGGQGAGGRRDRGGSARALGDPAHHRAGHRGAVAGSDHRRQRGRRDVEAGLRRVPRQRLAP